MKDWVEDMMNVEDFIKETLNIKPKPLEILAARINKIDKEEKECQHTCTTVKNVTSDSKT